MFGHNYAVGGAAITVEYYLTRLNNVTISNNTESAVQVRMYVGFSYYSYMCDLCYKGVYYVLCMEISCMLLLH